ncbi:hypothetical protein AD998_17425 [bacterium 336/3]|nr:hypothetical protein AD998_17425 [bacterium 336/3]
MGIFGDTINFDESFNKETIIDLLKKHFEKELIIEKESDTFFKLKILNYKGKGNGYIELFFSEDNDYTLEVETSLDKMSMSLGVKIIDFLKKNIV